MKDKLRIFIDMDGVLADFQKAADLIPDWAPEHDKKHPDEVLDFSTFEVIPGAKEAIAKLIDMGHDLFIASTPPWNNKAAWGQKGEWIDAERRIQRHTGPHRLLCARAASRPSRSQGQPSSKGNPRGSLGLYC